MLKRIALFIVISMVVVYVFAPPHVSQIFSAPTPVRPPAFVPTGTGAIFVTSSVEQSPARLIVDSDISASANISATKVQQGNGWTQLIDCDLSAQSTTNLNTLGTFTMCGLSTWRNEPANNAGVFGNGGNYVTNPSGTLDLTNGSGLVFAQILAAQSEWGSFTANNNNMRGGSAVWISLANLGVPSTFTWTSQIRIWVNVSSQSISECAQRSGLAIGLDNDQFHGGGVSGSGKWVGFFGARSCSSTTNPAFESDVIIGTGSAPALGTSATGQTSWNTNNATTVVYTGPIGRFGGNISAPLTMWQSQYSGGWANEATLIPWAVSTRTIGDVQTNDTGIGFLNADGGVDIRTRYGVVLASFKMSTTVAGSITVSRLRVDYKL